MKLREIWRSTSRGLLVLASFFVATQGSALTLDWTEIGWDPTDTSGLQEFSNVDGSGIDVAVSYTLNGFFNDGVPLLYTDQSAPEDEIVGSLKFVNQRVGAPTAPVTITLTFSEDVFIYHATLFSHSILETNHQEHSIVVARDLAGTAIAASAYGTTTPGLVELDADADPFHESIGLGFQNDAEYGTVVFEYRDNAIRSISYSLFIKETDTDNYIFGRGSMGIGLVDFSPDDFSPVPEPSTALLATLGLALHSRKRA